MAKKRVVVSPGLIQKPPPLHEMDEDYRFKLKEWMGDWYPEEFPDDEPTKLVVREDDKENQPSKPLILSLNKAKKRRLQCNGRDIHLKQFKLHFIITHD